jgi:hypothetical protein
MLKPDRKRFWNALVTCLSGEEIMKKITFALALGTALALCTAAQASHVYNRKTPRG